MMNAAERPCLLHRILALAAALLLLGGLFLSPALGLHAQAEEISSPQKLRVGYYAYTGFNMIDADGKKLRGIATLSTNTTVTTAT